MAALENRNGSYRIFFEYQRKQRVFTIRPRHRSRGEGQGGSNRLYADCVYRRGCSRYPPGIDIVAFVRHDGLMPAAQDTHPPFAVSRHSPNSGDRYLETHGNGNPRTSTRCGGIQRHFRHLGAVARRRFSDSQTVSLRICRCMSISGPKPRAGAAR